MTNLTHEQAAALIKAMLESERLGERRYNILNMFGAWKYRYVAAPWKPSGWEYPGLYVEYDDITNSPHPIVHFICQMACGTLVYWNCRRDTPSVDLIRMDPDLYAGPGYGPTKQAKVEIGFMCRFDQWTVIGNINDDLVPKNGDERSFHFSRKPVTN